METLIQDHWQVMGEFDRERRVKLAVMLVPPAG